MNTQPDKTKSEHGGKGQHGKKSAQQASAQQSSSRVQQTSVPAPQTSQSTQQPLLNTLFLGMSAQQANTPSTSKSSQQPNIRVQMPSASSQQPNIRVQMPSASSQQSSGRTQLRSISTQQPSISSQQPNLRIAQLRSVGTQQSNLASQQSGMRTLQPSVQLPSMSSQQVGTSIQQSSGSTQQISVGTQLPNMSAQQVVMNFQQASMSSQQPGTSSQQLGMSSQPPSVISQHPGLSAQHPGLGAQHPGLSAHQINLSSQQINMLNQMNLHGHPITIMSAQPIGMNLSNQPMSLNSQQLALSMNPQLMNLNLHAQPIPMSVNTQHMLNIHAPHLNIHGHQLNMPQQPLTMGAQHLNLHPQLGMTGQQYNMHQMRYHHMGPQMYMNPHLASGSSQHLNMQPAVMHTHQASGEVPRQSIPEPVDREKVCQWLLEINDPSTRENALIELGKRREDIPDLAVMIWHGFGTAAALLQEIMSIYSAINPAVLSAAQSNRVCNALALLQCVAANPETRPLFMAAQFPLFLYPFLHTISKNRPFEYLRLTCLGVIGALVKSDEPEVIQYLLDTEIIPLCLRVMECGSELSKIVATFILQKVLANEKGLNYICETYERFSHIAMILGKLVLTLAAYPSARLLKHIVRCYLRLSEHPRAKEALRQCLPDQLADTTFHECLQDEPATRSWIAELLVNLEMPPKSYYDPRLYTRSSTATTPH